MVSNSKDKEIHKEICKYYLMIKNELSKDMKADFDKYLSLIEDLHYSEKEKLR